MKRQAIRDKIEFRSESLIKGYLQGGNQRFALGKIQILPAQGAAFLEILALERREGRVEAQPLAHSGHLR